MSIPGSEAEMSQSPIPMSTLLHWRARLVPESLGLGWMPIFNLGYLTFLSMPFVLSWFGDARGGWVGPAHEVLGPTLLSIVVFLPLYFAAYRLGDTGTRLCMLAIAGVGYALYPVNPFANAYIIYAVAFAATIERSLRAKLAWASAILGVMLLQTYRLDYPVFVFLITLLVSVGVFFGNYHFAISTRRSAELKLSHDEVRRLATVAERERIGRDLHDLLGHTLSLVALKSDLAAKLLQRGDSPESREAAQREIAEVSRVARDALAQVRTAVTGIRAAGLAAELVSARLLLDSDDIAFDTTIARGALDGGVLLPPVESALALTLREAVTNLQRHARARHAKVELALEWGEVVLRVSDDGRGGALVPGNGLTGMRERIEALGGRLRIESGKGKGTRIEARLPLAMPGAGDTDAAQAARA
jgi:two-component system, NarL family, sensor histidine kinase DesK